MSPGLGLSPSGPAEFVLAEIIIGGISVGNGMAARRFAPFYYQRVHDHFKAPGQLTAKAGSSHLSWLHFVEIAGVPVHKISK